jgi:SRP72 RNA-binding domain
VTSTGSAVEDQSPELGDLCLHVFACAAAEVGANKGKKKSKKRKPRYPVGFDPANPGPPPDPERWLAKWQRSDFKKPRKSRRTKVSLLVMGRALHPAS